MTTKLKVKDFCVSMTYDKAVAYVDERGYRLLTFDEWAYNNEHFVSYSWLQSPVVPSGAARVLALGYYSDCCALSDIFYFSGRVVGVKK